MHVIGIRKQTSRKRPRFKYIPQSFRSLAPAAYDTKVSIELFIPYRNCVPINAKAIFPSPIPEIISYEPTWPKKIKFTVSRKAETTLHNIDGIAKLVISDS